MSADQSSAPSADSARPLPKHIGNFVQMTKHFHDSIRGLAGAIRKLSDDEAIQALADQVRCVAAIWSDDVRLFAGDQTVRASAPSGAAEGEGAKSGLPEALKAEITSLDMQAQQSDDAIRGLVKAIERLAPDETVRILAEQIHYHSSVLSNEVNCFAEGHQANHKGDRNG